MLKIKNLSKAHGNVPVLNHLSLNIASGQVTILLGSSGAGKSTLLRILNNLESLDSGTIEFEGTELNLDQINKNHTIGIVFQNFNLFEHLTVEQNITIALEQVAQKNKQEAQHSAHELLRQYGLLDKANNMIGQLSGGQKQRLAIARTLSLQPKIVCLDEPTSALDPWHTKSIVDEISRLAQAGFSVLIATHDMSLLEKISCTVHLMHKGAIIESATSHDFLANKKGYPHLEAFVAGKLVEQNNA